MSVKLTPVMEVGAHKVAAVVRDRVSAHAALTVAHFSASKAPLAVLVFDGVSLDVRLPDGTAMTLAELDALCPGAAGTMQRG